jgi:hypothetical protein
VVLQKRIGGDRESPFAGFAPITLDPVRSGATFLELNAAAPSAFFDGDRIQELRLVSFLERWTFDLVKVADAVVDELLIAIRPCLVGPRSLFPGFGSVFTVGHVEVLASPRRQCRDFHINYIAARKCSSSLLEGG